MQRKERVLNVLEELKIEYIICNHPSVSTVEEASKYWIDIESAHCKNLFFRNHKGNRHFLVLLDHKQNLDIKNLEQRLQQGKISFASDKRLNKYLGVKAGSVSPFGLMNDIENHVHVFIDDNLKKTERISFHPNDNTATVVISFKDFIRFLDWTKNKYEFLTLYDLL